MHLFPGLSQSQARSGDSAEPSPFEEILQSIRFVRIVSGDVACRPAERKVSLTPTLGLIVPETVDNATVFKLRSALTDILDADKAAAALQLEVSERDHLWNDMIEALEGFELDDTSSFDFLSGLKNITQFVLARDGEIIASKGLSDMGAAAFLSRFSTVAEDRLRVSNGELFGLNRAPYALVAQSDAPFNQGQIAILKLYIFQMAEQFYRQRRLALEIEKKELEHAALHDPLTNIPNLRAFRETLKEALQGDPNAALAIFLIDLDRFKYVNDTFGHEAGDAVLLTSADILKQAAGPGNLTTRIGGDEFAIFFAAPPDDLQQLAETTIAALSAPITYKGNTFQVGASIGYMTFAAGQYDSPDQVLLYSDLALYEAKIARDRAVAVTPAMITTYDRRARDIADIKRGVAAEEFSPFFQPIINLSNHSIEGFEVLARWQHPDRGVLTPADFLDLSASARLLSDIDAQMRRRAIQVFSEWISRGHDFQKLSFNLTHANLMSRNFEEQLTDELFAFGLPNSMVQLELLESVVFSNNNAAIVRRCHALRAAGFTLALDDFGTGYASIATLVDTPVDLIKIDRSFVIDMPRNERLRRITTSVLAMAHELHLPVLGEGVETEEALHILQDLDCQFAQGNFFAPALPETDVLPWAEEFAQTPPQPSAVRSPPFR